MSVHFLPWNLGVFVLRVLFSKSFQRRGVAHGLYPPIVCPLWSAAHGCGVPWREWSLKFLLGCGRRGVLLPNNTIFIDQGMHTKIFSSVVFFPRHNWVFLVNLIWTTQLYSELPFQDWGQLKVKLKDFKMFFMLNANSNSMPTVILV